MSKKKIVILCPYPFGQAASQRFRYEQYINILTNAGFQLTIKPFLSTKSWKIAYKSKNGGQKAMGFIRGFFLRFFSLPFITKYDCVFIHREAAPLGPPVFEFLIAKIFRKKIIYDYDDAIWLANTSTENKFVAGLKHHSKVNAICRWSYKISCGNDYLAAYARQLNANVVVNPTTIDTEFLHNPSLYPRHSAEERLTIGWTGSHSTLKYLAPMVEIMDALGKKFPGQVRFLVIADRPPDFCIPLLEFVRWSLKTEIEDLMAIDIGVMPLTQDEWTNGKCGFKLLQYMALEIPAVASDAGVNSKIIDQGENGYLCATPEAWVECLEKLIRDKKLRESIGQKGRQKIITHYSVISNTANFVSLFR
jgi:glycosyltransferase involved in cell wall biosynthesis